MYNDHQAELDVLRNTMDPLNEDDSIIDLTTRVRARHDANDELDRRIMQRLSQTQHGAHAAAGETNDSNLQVWTFTVSITFNALKSDCKIYAE